MSYSDKVQVVEGEMGELGTMHMMPVLHHLGR